MARITSLLLGAATAFGAAPKPNIVLLMIDDLGRYDTQVHNPDAPTPTIGKLVSEGIMLDRHYVYMYCSPTRRSFLAGRFPTSINPDQAGTCDNQLPLKFTLVSEKLKLAGYASHFVGKGHLGYATVDHMPINRGYDSHVGYLGGSEDYFQATWPGKDKDFWHNDHPGSDVISHVHYSTNYYSNYAVNIISNHNTSIPLFLDLRYQGVHGPYEEPPIWEQVANTTANNHICGDPSHQTTRTQVTCQTLLSMLSVVDSGIANVTSALRTRGMWGNTLVIFSADNGGGAGGGEPSNNFPLRGTKAEPWDGAVRVAAFVAGGLIPAALRGTTNTAFMHIADWYPTICNLAGVDPTDNVMYNGTLRPIDGIDTWPVLTGAKPDLGREWLPTTNQSLVWQSRWKLITGAPSTHWFNNDTRMTTWLPDSWGKPGGPKCKEVHKSNVATKGIWACAVCTDAEPCLFDLIADPQERNDVAKDHPGIVKKIQDHMYGLNFPPYTSHDLLDGEDEGYDCLWTTKQGEKKLDPAAARTQWWTVNNVPYSGPCCKRKSP